MDLHLADRGDVTVATISGRIDSMTADRLTEALGAPLKGGRIRLVADFSGVDYTSSAGLRSLLISVKESRRLGGDLRLAALQPEVERVLQIAGFTSILKVYPDVASAVSSFAAAR